MPQPLTVLLVEDDPEDADLILRELRRSGFDPKWERVDTEPAYLERLNDNLDLVLSDYRMPKFDGLRALDLLKERNFTVPFILVSGTIGEDAAVQAMKKGVADYLLKDRLVRLGPAVTHALSDSRQKRERRQADEALRLFRMLMDQSVDILQIIDPATGRLLDVNEKGSTQLGCPRSEYLQLHIYDIDPTLTESAWAALAEKIRSSGSLSGESCHRRRDGTLFPVEFNSKWVRLDRDYIVSVVRDISARKKSEDALRASEERFRQLAENINEVFWIVDPSEDHLLYISPAYERIWGRPCETLYANRHSWITAVHPDDRDRVQREVTSAMVTGKFDEEFRIFHSDGSERWIHDRAFPVRGLDGGIQRLVGVAEDITESKKLREQFLRAQRMEAVGTLAGGLAHDLNNVLAPILIGVPVLREQITDDASIQLLKTMEASVKRGASIISRVLSFARGSEGQRMLLDPRDLVREIEEISTETFPKSIHIETFVPKDVWPVLGDMTQLHQALLNLTVNARDAMMPAGGRLRIEVQNTWLDDHYAAMTRDVKPGPYLLIEVSDTGPGVPYSIREKIFDPFFTTKEVGKGTGLGLASTLGIVKGHGGFIQVDGETNQGAVFKIYLPAEPLETAAPHSEEADLPRGEGELILIVDDEEPIREVMQTLLSNSGYRVLSACNGAEAVALYAQHRTNIAAVVTDIVMPVMDGVATVAALRQLNPTVQIIAASGLPAHVEVNHFLPKPYTSSAMLRALRSMLRPSGNAKPKLHDPESLFSQPRSVIPPRETM